MRIAIIGCGNQGTGIAAQLLHVPDVEAITMLDYNPAASERAIKLIGTLNSAGIHLQAGAVNATDIAALVEAFRNADFVVNATLPEFNLKIMKACLQSQSNYLDLYAHPPSEAAVAGSISEQLQLHDQFSERDLIAVPSVGVNPGWMNLAAKKILRGMEHVAKVDVRELEWLDSDELLVSGPAQLLVELFCGAPGPAKMVHGVAEPVELVSGAEEYEFVAPVGRQWILPTVGLGTATMIHETSSVPIDEINERFAVISAGLSMKDVLLRAVADQLKTTNASDNMSELFASSFKPTTSVDIFAMHENGELRDAAWISSIELIGTEQGKRMRRLVQCVSTLQDSLKLMPWAPPGVVATSALPSQLIADYGRGALQERGVWEVQDLALAGSILDQLHQRGCRTIYIAEPHD